MKILLVSSLLALAVSSVAPEDKTENKDVQRPGMCFKDYFAKYPDEMEKIKKKMIKEREEMSNPERLRPGALNQYQGWSQNQEEDGRHPQSNHAPKQKFDFSKLRDCSVDHDCQDTEKCCSSKYGMKCTKPMFRNHTMKTSEDHLPGEPAKEPEEKHEETRPRQKSHASEGGEGSKGGAPSKKEQQEEGGVKREREN